VCVCLVVGGRGNGDWTSERKKEDVYKVVRISRSNASRSDILPVSPGNVRRSYLEERTKARTETKGPPRK